MLSRKYNRKVDIYKTSISADGFGGNTVSDVLIGSFWAEIKQNFSSRDNSVGMSSIKYTYSFKIRSNPNIYPDLDKDNLSVKYRNKKYVINELTYDDELFRFVNLIANG